MRGRLLGQPLGSGKVQFTVLQSYDYQSNDAYATGAQSFEAAVGVTQPLSSRTNVWLMGWGGLTVLGAVDSLPLGITELPGEPEEPEEPEGGQGVSEGPRFYDYGPGSTFGAVAHFARDRRVFASFCTRVVISTRWTASAPTTSCSGRAWICCCLCAARSVSACPESISSVRASTRTRLARRWNIATPSSARISRGASSEPPAARELCGGLLLAWLAPSVVAAQSAPSRRLQPCRPTRSRRRRGSGSWPAARLLPCAAIVRRAKRTSPTVTRGASSPMSGIA